MAAATRQKLEEAVRKVVSTKPGEADTEPGRSALRLLQTGVQNASSGRNGSPKELLADLEPKGRVLEFILEIHEKKKAYRKITVSTLRILLEQRSWANAVKADEGLLGRMPDDVKDVLGAASEEEKEEEAPAAPEEPPPRAQPEATSAPPQAEQPASASATAAAAEAPPSSNAGAAPAAATPAPAASGPKIPTQTAVGRAIGRAWKDVEQVRAGQGRPKAAAAAQASGIHQIREGKAAMERLDYQAKNTDAASAAFETFRKGMRRVASGPESDIEEVKALDPKDSILEFLVDLYERRGILRSRVSSILVQLLDFDEWAAAADADPSVRALVKTVVAPKPPSLEQLKRAATLAAFKTGDGVVNLRRAAAGAAKRGKLGVLLVRIRAAHNLEAPKSGGIADPYVRVQFAGRMRRTESKESTHNPKWDSEPFIFDVTSMDDVASFEVLDSDATEELVMGTLEVSMSDAGTKADDASIRRPLEGATRGELEIDFVFAAAEGAPTAGFDPPPRDAAAAPAAAAPAAAAPAPAAPAREDAAALARGAPPVKDARAPAAAGPPAAVASRSPPVTAEGARPEPARASAAAGPPTVTDARSPLRGDLEKPGPTWVAWLSIDPRSGRLQFYPGNVCDMIEQSYQRRDKGIDLGDAFYGARVFFYPRMVQRTARGSRDIRRIEMKEPKGSATVHVVRGTDWRSADDLSAAGVEERHEPVPEGAAVRAGTIVRFSG